MSDETQQEIETPWEHYRPFLRELVAKGFIQESILERMTRDHGEQRVGYAALYANALGYCEKDCEQVVRAAAIGRWCCTTSQRELAALYADFPRKLPINPRVIDVLAPYWFQHDHRLNRLSQIQRQMFDAAVLHAQIDGDLIHMPSGMKSTREYSDLANKGLILSVNRRPFLHPDFHPDLLIAWQNWIADADPVISQDRFYLSEIQKQRQEELPL